MSLSEEDVRAQVCEAILTNCTMRDKIVCPKCNRARTQLIAPQEPTFATIGARARMALNRPFMLVFECCDLPWFGRFQLTGGVAVTSKTRPDIQYLTDAFIAVGHPIHEPN